MKTIRKAFLYLFACCGLFLLLAVLLFTLLEVSPTLQEKISLTKLPYYALRQRYQYDPELVFRGKSNYSSQSFLKANVKDPKGLEPTYTRTPYQLTFDKDGFRQSTSEGQVDVIIVGDSFMNAGNSDDDTFAEHLSQLTGSPVGNLGTSSYGPQQYLLSLKRYGLHRNPKFVLYAFFEGNDIRDTAAFDEWRNGKLYYRYGSERLPFHQRFSLVSSQVSELLQKTFQEHIRFPLAKWRGRYIDVDMQRSVMIRLKDYSFRDSFDYHSEIRPPRELLKSNEWRLFLQTLSEFHQICKENNITPLVLFIPTKRHIYSPFVGEGSGAHWEKDKQEQLPALSYTEDALREVVSQEGISYLSFSPLFQEKTELGQRLFYIFDSHWNSEGRKRAAEATYAKLLELEAQTRTSMNPPYPFAAGRSARSSAFAKSFEKDPL